MFVDLKKTGCETILQGTDYHKLGPTAHVREVQSMPTWLTLFLNASPIEP